MVCGGDGKGRKFFGENVWFAGLTKNREVRGWEYSEKENVTMCDRQTELWRFTILYIIIMELVLSDVKQIILLC